MHKFKYCNTEFTHTMEMTLAKIRDQLRFRLACTYDLHASLARYIPTEYNIYLGTWTMQISMETHGYVGDLWIYIQNIIDDYDTITESQ